jgi:Holliday junction resolvasome RuvABC endonuclease subunit
MMSNPLNILLGAARGGVNTNALMQQMAMNNPQVNQIMKLMQGKTPAELEQMARNMARERGTTIEDIARGLGISVPSER